MGILSSANFLLLSSWLFFVHLRSDTSKVMNNNTSHNALYKYAAFSNVAAYVRDFSSVCAIVRGQYGFFQPTSPAGRPPAIYFYAPPCAPSVLENFF